MSMLDKARAIHYAMSKAAEIEARSVPLEKFADQQVARLRQVADSIRMRGGEGEPTYAHLAKAIGVVLEPFLIRRCI